jgi:hypothetical protein
MICRDLLWGAAVGIHVKAMQCTGSDRAVVQEPHVYQLFSMKISVYVTEDFIENNWYTCDS